MASFGLSANSAAAATQEAIEPSTPWLAAADGKLALLQTSLQSLGLPVGAADENGYTLLQAAASYGHVPVIQWILSENCVNVNSVDNEGDSALHYSGTFEATKFLVEVAGVSPKIQNKQGKTALQHKEEELKTLLEEDEEDSDCEDAESLKKQIEYLRSLPAN